jgi:carboxymethylenebutenolidase
VSKNDLSLQFCVDPLSMASALMLAVALCAVGIIQQGAGHIFRRSTQMESLWEDHLRHEFDPAFKSVDATMETMVSDPYVNHVPTLTGGAGSEAVREFYRTSFIYSNPAMNMTLVSRTIGRDKLVDEMILDFNHTVYVDWLAPSVAPSGRRVKFPLVVIVEFATEKGGELKVRSEHIYWDQATVLLQLGALHPTDLSTGVNLDISGIEQAMKVEDPSSVEQNAMLSRALESRVAGFTGKEGSSMSSQEGSSMAQQGEGA